MVYNYDNEEELILLNGLPEVSKNNNLPIKSILAIWVCIFLVVSLFFTNYYLDGKLETIKVEKAKLIAENEEDAREQERLREEEYQREKEEIRLREELQRKLNESQTYNPNGQNELEAIFSSKEKIAYLTYDDGPSSDVTPILLDVLKEENVPVTFFVVARMVRQNPEILKRAYLEGHFIANHSATHNYEKIYQNLDTIYQEIEETEQEIQKVLSNNFSTFLFRFPGGSSGGKYKDIKALATKDMRNRGIAYINWNSLTNDSAGATTYEKQVEEFEKSRSGKNGLIVLMHDNNGKSVTIETTKYIINTLRNEGYEFRNFYDIFPKKGQEKEKENISKEGNSES